ncbi:MAG: sulfotransferase family protein [Melioribacteraceae bacterium]|nr:sulfotransferase family protein [Melioribacteraceae bacterium]
MLVSHKHKFIYTKTAKTGGTSIEYYFERFCLPDGEFTRSHERDEYESETGIVGFRGKLLPEKVKWWNHMAAFQIKEQLGDEIWNSYFKFCSIRNPFERCISHYEYAGKNLERPLSEKIKRRFKNPFTSEEKRKFEYVLVHQPSIDRNKYLIDGEFCLDDVIRYENLEAEIERICEKLSLPFEPKNIPKFKSDVRRPNTTIESLYTKRSLAYVKKIYKYEIDKFGYEIPSMK